MAGCSNLPSTSAQEFQRSNHLRLIFSEERQCYLSSPSGGHMHVKYLNGLQILGFSFGFLGLVNTLLGLLDVIVIPTFSPIQKEKYPVELSLANVYGLPIYSGFLIIATGAMGLRTMISRRYTSLRKFYISLWFTLFMTVIYWFCFIAAIFKGYLSTLKPFDKISSSLLVTRVFTAVNFGLILIPCLTGLVLYTRNFLTNSPICNCVQKLFRWTKPIIIPSPTQSTNRFHNDLDPLSP